MLQPGRRIKKTLGKLGRKSSSGRAELASDPAGEPEGEEAEEIPRVRGKRKKKRDGLKAQQEIPRRKRRRRRGPGSPRKTRRRRRGEGDKRQKTRGEDKGSITEKTMKKGRVYKEEKKRT